MLPGSTSSLRGVFDEYTPSTNEAGIMLADLVRQVFGSESPIRIDLPDGSRAGPVDGPAAVVVRNDDAIRRMLSAPGELGLCRAYVSGDLDVRGDLVSALDLLAGWIGDVRLDARRLKAAATLLGRYGMRRPPIPPEEVKRIGRGRLHSRGRDAAAIAHHYDISNEFYEVVLGPSMCYSCALWSEPGATLEQAQDAKFDLVCTKLDLRPGMRLFDAGCGWGTLAIHAARHYGVSVLGATLSVAQADYCRDAVARAGVADRVEIQLLDYRDVVDSFDAISSVGMLEHVGNDLPNYAETFSRLLRPEGRFLHHAISQVGARRERPLRPTIMSRYVFPDAALLEIGHVASAFHDAGLEVRHLESLRDHYPLTLAAWLHRLEASWDQAVALVGEPRARIWRLYMAGGLLGFRQNRVQIHQILSVKPGASGESGMSLVPGDWSRRSDPVRATAQDEPGSREAEGDHHHASDQTART
jgi:cyclopropane-fatty-acyl-phospholipid synthase